MDPAGPIKKEMERFNHDPPGTDSGIQIVDFGFAVF